MVRRSVKRWIVDHLEKLCSALDCLPAIWYTRGFGWSFVLRDGQFGCLLGVSRWSVALDDRWHTGHWRSRDVTELA